MCPNRILVQSGIYDHFVEEFAKQVSSLKVGDGFEEDVHQGPLITSSAVEKVWPNLAFPINAHAFNKVERHVQDAADKGGEVLVGGAKVAELPGTFYHPSVLINVTQDMVITQEETFGPVAPVIK